MNLPVDPVRSMEDATLNFEQLQAVLTKPGGQLPFLQLLAAQQLAFAFGASSVTYTASATSASSTVTHNLGRAPKVFFVQVAQGAGGAMPFVSLSYTATTATYRGEYWSAITGTFTTEWFAIG